MKAKPTKSTVRAPRVPRSKMPRTGASTTPSRHRAPRSRMPRNTGTTSDRVVLPHGPSTEELPAPQLPPPPETITVPTTPPQGEVVGTVSAPPVTEPVATTASVSSAPAASEPAVPDTTPPPTPVTAPAPQRPKTFMALLAAIFSGSLPNDGIFRVRNCAHRLERGRTLFGRLHNPITHQLFNESQRIEDEFDPQIHSSISGRGHWKTELERMKAQTHFEILALLCLEAVQAEFPYIADDAELCEGWFISVPKGAVGEVLFENEKHPSRTFFAELASILAGTATFMISPPRGYKPVAPHEKVAGVLTEIIPFRLLTFAHKLNSVLKTLCLPKDPEVRKEYLLDTTPREVNKRQKQAARVASQFKLVAELFWQAVRETVPGLENWMETPYIALRDDWQVVILPPPVGVPRSLGARGEFPIFLEFLAGNGDGFDGLSFELPPGLAAVLTRHR